MVIPLELEPVLGFLETNRSFRVGDDPGILEDLAKRRPSAEIGSGKACFESPEDPIQWPGLRIPE